jgi:aryl-alcohol dehydrogenase-like predicted oxidoreductase
MKNTNIQLGCGLIRIGRTWGYKKENIPTEEEVQHFLSEAVKLGIRFFDTAPAYGTSEERLGNFLKTLSPTIRKSLTIGTKCGEFWDAEKESTIVNHSYDSLVQSIDNSIALLGRVDVLQIHKVTPLVLQSDEVHKALKYAKSHGVTRLGASVSDLATAIVAVKYDELSVIQLPFNPEREDMKEVLELLKAHDKYIIINRPFNMGGMLYNDQQQISKQKVLAEAYGFIIKEDFNGVILSGTSDVNHLQENLAAFTTALRQYNEK